MHAARRATTSILTLLILACALAGCGRRADERALVLFRETCQQIEAGDLDAALATADRAVNLAPNSHYSWSALGAVRLNEAQYAAAEEAFRRGIDIAPGEPDLRFGLAVALDKQGKHREAVAEFRTVLGAGHRIAEARTRLAAALVWMGEWDEAASQARDALALSPSDGVAHLTLGYALYAQGEIDASIIEFEQAVKLMPDSAEARAHLAEALREAGRTEEAAEQARRAAEQDGLAQPHMTLGMILYERGRPEEALEQFRTAVAIEPDYAQAHYDLGAPLAQLGRLDEAAEAYRRALELAPFESDYATAYVRLLERTGRLDEALAAQPRVAAASTEAPDQHVVYAQMLRSAGRVDQATAEYRRAAALAPDNPQIAEALAGTLQAEGRFEDAATEYRRAAELQPYKTAPIAKATNLLVVVGDPAAAVEFLRGLEGRVPDDLSAWLSARLSWALIYTGETAEARRRLLQVAASGPDSRASGALAPCWMYLGEWDSALEDLRRAPSDASETRSGSLTEAIVLALSGRLDESATLLRALAPPGGRPRMWTGLVLAYVLASQGEREEARTLLAEASEALSWEYTALEPLYLAGLAYRELGDTEKSDALFRRAIDRWPRHPWCQKMREMMAEDARS